MRRRAEACIVHAVLANKVPNTAAAKSLFLDAQAAVLRNGKPMNEARGVVEGGGGGGGGGGAGVER